MNEDEIKGILERLALDRPSTWRTVVARLGEHDAALFRGCAIAHRITEDVVRAVAPDVDDDEAEALFARFAGLKVVLPQAGGLMLHDDARRELFTSWFARPDEFRDVSARLVALHEQLAARADNPDDAQAHVSEALFHRVAVDQNVALERFLDLFHIERRLGQVSRCAQLIALIEEYGDFLTFASVRILRYVQGLLAMDRGDWSEAIEIFALLENDPEGDPHFKLTLVMQKGRALLALGETARAAEVFESGIARAKAPGAPPLVLASLIFDRADTLIRQGEVNDAERTLRQGLDVAKSSGDPRLEARGLDTLAFLLRRRLDFRLAIDIYQQTLEIHKRLRDERCQAHVLGGLGMAHMEIGEYQRALEIFEARLTILRRLGDRHGEAVTLNNLLRIYLHSNNHRKAITSAEHAADLFLATRDRIRSATTRFNLGKIYRKVGDTEAASENFKTAESLFSEVGALEQAAAVRHEMARLAL
jgi:tetratricopeptide (TPR) repeat protein